MRPVLMITTCLALAACAGRDARFALALCLALGGCAQMAANRQAQLDAQAARYEAQGDRTCQGYGARPGSPEYINCRLALRQQDTTREAAAMQAGAITNAATQATAQSLIAAGMAH